MTKEMSDLINRRKSVIDTFKTELIRRLNLPYAPEDLHEDVIGNNPVYRELIRR